MFATVSYLAVCVDGHLLGLVEIERVLAAAPDAAVDRLMDHDPAVVGPDTDQEIAARLMIDHGEGSLAVVDHDGVFLGLIVASVVALVLPWLLTRFHKDPAFGAGPLATVVQDLLSIAIYLALASVIVG